MYPIPHRHRTRQLQIQIIYCTDSCTLYSPAFLHMTVLCCLQSPPLPANIYTEVVLGRGKEEEEFTTLDTRYSTFVTFVYTHTSSVHHCIPYIFKHYCIVLEQYTFLGNSTHYTYFTCSLTPLAAALFHSTV